MPSLVKVLPESTIQGLHSEILRKDAAFDKVSERLQRTEDKYLQLENQHGAEILARASAEQALMEAGSALTGSIQRKSSYSPRKRNQSTHCATVLGN